MADLTPQEKYKLETLKAREHDTQRDMDYHEQVKTRHEAALNTGAINLADIRAEIEALEAKNK